MFTKKQHIEKPNKFQLCNPKTSMLNVSNEVVFIKVGCMDSYYGKVTFEKTGITNGGIGNLLKGMVTGDTLHLMKATTKGSGVIFVSDSDHGFVPGGRTIFNFALGKEVLIVNASHILAFEENVKWEVKFNKSFSSYVQGGLGNVYLTGPGWCSITCFGEYVVHLVTEDSPLCTSPHATVCWTDGLTVNVKTDLQWGNLIGRGSGESIQMNFSGKGYVVVQSGHHPIEQQKH